MSERLTRAQRSALRRAAWAAAVARMRDEVDAAAVPTSADKATKKAARAARRAALGRRDGSWRAEVAALGGSVARRRAAPSTTAQIEAVESGVAATWQAGAGPSREQRHAANARRWALLQQARLQDLAGVRTARRGERRRAHSKAWLAAQAARLQVPTNGDHL